MADKGYVRGLKFNDRNNFFCETCQFGKSHKLSFVRRESPQSWAVGEFFHSDVCGPFSEVSLGGARYFLAFKDDASGYRVVFFIKHKSDVFDRFKEFERLVANHFGRYESVESGQWERVCKQGHDKLSLCVWYLNGVCSTVHTPAERENGARQPNYSGECALHDNCIEAPQDIVGGGNKYRCLCAKSDNIDAVIRGYSI